MGILISLTGNLKVKKMDYKGIYGKALETSQVIFNEIININDTSKIESNDYGLIFELNNKDKPKITITFSSIISDKRIELYLSKPKLVNDNKYIIIGEFWDLGNQELDDISKIIKSVVSNPVKIIEFYSKDKLLKTSYSYCYYAENKPKIISETFRNKLFIFPWQKKNIQIKEYIFEPWIESEFTLKK